eukprot:TRINITY_DN2361_c0_g1_i1.p1 TRINITY_DN2361_c0_g1~~TRINITY_DN2361_c0_g1_i1.p1  ORF type:complete len:296 (+),score=49.54 TRINITY_DN2361_c0_g1_i1:615-1502(+)
MLNGREKNRKSCRGWQGARIAPAPPPRLSNDEDSDERPAKKARRPSTASAPLPPDGYYLTCASDLLTPQMRGRFLTKDSPADIRFNYLLPSHPAGVPVSLLFPTGKLAGDRLYPMCSTGDFAKDVGIANAQHLGSMIRGLEGRKSCSGWKGGVCASSPLTSPEHSVGSGMQSISAVELDPSLPVSWSVHGQPQVDHAFNAQHNLTDTSAVLHRAALTHGLPLSRSVSTEAVKQIEMDVMRELEELDFESLIEDDNFLVFHQTVVPAAEASTEGSPTSHCDVNMTLDFDLSVPISL